eukprot:Colp12_sorted_trinity150504_noHs@28529
MITVSWRKISAKTPTTRNPRGRTGLKGRGLLGRWGPNHAADPIVSRWKKDSSGNKVLKDGKPVLQFVAIERTVRKRKYCFQVISLSDIDLPHRTVEAGLFLVAWWSQVIQCLPPSRRSLARKLWIPCLLQMKKRQPLKRSLRNCLATALRCTVGMWTTRATLTMRGWKRSRSTSTTRAVSLTGSSSRLGMTRARCSGRTLTRPSHSMQAMLTSLLPPPADSPPTYSLVCPCSLPSHVLPCRVYPLTY